MRENIAYITGFDPSVYRRPLFARKALSNLKVYSLRSIIGRLKTPGIMFFKASSKLAKIESLLFKSSRSGGDYYLSALLREAIVLTGLRGLNAESIIALNPYLASRRLWGNERSIIVDWMDVWMWPWDEMNLLDVKAVEEADAVIFWSKPMLELGKYRLKLKHYAYIPYGIELSIFNPQKYGNSAYFKERYGLKKHFILLYSGGVWKVEGQDLQGTDKMIKAFTLAAKKLENVKLVLQTSKVDAHTMSLLKYIANKVILIGAFPYYASFLRQSAFSAADVILAPTSRHPIVYYAERMKYFEYMAAGKAILAEKSPGALSALGDAAFYVNLDDVEGMADAIVELYSNKDLRERLGFMAYERAKLFDWNNLAPKYRNFILEVIG
jgi:glycosyltransferase involved in cell wall biosynthesis